MLKNIKKLNSYKSKVWWQACKNGRLKIERAIEQRQTYVRNKDENAEKTIIIDYISILDET